MDLDEQAHHFIGQIRAAVPEATPTPKERAEQELIYPTKIGDLIKERKTASVPAVHPKIQQIKQSLNHHINSVNQHIKDY